MTTRALPKPVPFTARDFEDRRARVVAAAQDAGLDGVLVAPGPDLVWLTGYQPTWSEVRTRRVSRSGIYLAGRSGVRIEEIVTVTTEGGGMAVLTQGG